MLQTEQILSVSQVSKTYGTKTVLEHVSLFINRGDRIGLVGENGTGKTTLAGIIMGTVEADDGRISFAPGVVVGYLPQEAAIDDAISVQDFLERSLGRLDALRDELAALETEMGKTGLESGLMAALIERYGKLQDEYVRRGGYETDIRLDQLFAGLDLASVDRSRSMQTLSGGEKTRAMLAGLLLSAPDLLILDEPTNHLDFAALDWLEDYLSHYYGSLLVISHDRRFLNKVIKQIAELSPLDHTLTAFHGNYDAFAAERQRLRILQQEAYQAQRDERHELQRLIKQKTHNLGKPPPMKDNNKMAYDAAGERAQQTRARVIRNARQRLEELEENLLERPARRWQINPDFAPEDLASRDVIRFTDLGKRFGDRILFEGLTATIRSGERVVLRGPNGLGKTTLLRLILGLETPSEGTIATAAGAKIGYLDQEQETLPLGHTVLEEFSRGQSGVSETDLRSALHKYGLFKESQVFQLIDSLSIGQRRKLQIARLIAQRANVLLLDEPTNHLDLESVEQFEQALVEFPGTILATSHDRWFIERIATHVWTFEAGHLVTYQPAPV